jgi:recombinational DNA repair ATPase RecF
VLEALDLRNFKAWRQAKIDFSGITGLFGKNSSGKSSLIQFLLMLKQTREERDRATVLQLNGPYAELEHIPVEFTRSPHGGRNSGIPSR